MLYSAPHQAFRSFLYAQFPWVRKMFPEPFTRPEFTAWFKSLLDHAIEMRRTANIKRDDYLNFLIELQDKKSVPMEMIYSHAYTYFLDGFETTSHTLGNAVNNLAENKECQQQLRAEVDRYDQPIGFDDLHQMPYLDAVVNGKSFFFHSLTSHTFHSKRKKQLLTNRNRTYFAISVCIVENMHSRHSFGRFRWQKLSHWERCWDHFAHKFIPLPSRFLRKPRKIRSTALCGRWHWS